MKPVKINCTSTDTVHLHQLKIIQGDLKDLTTENYKKYKKSILKHGIMKPVNIWMNDKNEYCVIDGTQLVRALMAMEQEGHEIPPLPITIVDAKSLPDAKDKILSLASYYGTVNPMGFMEFTQDLPYKDLEDLANATAIPGVDFKALEDEFNKDMTSHEQHDLDDKEKHQTKKFILELEFPDQQEMMTIHDELLSRGYIAKVKSNG